MKRTLYLILFLVLFPNCKQQSAKSNTIQYLNSPKHLQKGYPFSEATIVNGIVYVSGQIGTLKDGRVIQGGIEKETLQSLKNIESVLERLGGSKKDIFKCTCMLKTIEDWPSMSKAYEAFFDKNMLPARSAFAGSGLAMGALVEIECMARAQQ